MEAARGTRPQFLAVYALVHECPRHVRADGRSVRSVVRTGIRRPEGAAYVDVRVRLVQMVDGAQDQAEVLDLKSLGIGSHRGEARRSDPSRSPTSVTSQ